MRLWTTHEFTPWILAIDPERCDGTLWTVIMEFDQAGVLTYSIILGDRTQIFKLTYAIDGGTILSDQPSAPRKERTRFSVGPDGVLELEKAGERTWYERV